MFESPAALFGVAVQRDVECDCNRMARIEPDIDSDGPLQAANHQHRSNHQDDREHYLRADQQVAHLHAAESLGHLVFQSGQKIDARGLDGGRKSKQNRGQHTGRERKQKHTIVEWKRRHGGNVDGEADRAEDFENPHSQQDASGGAGNRQHQAFGEQLTDDSSARRANRQANRDFFAPHGGARQQHAGDVHAGDQQHQASNRYQHGSESQHRSAQE